MLQQAFFLGQGKGADFGFMPAVVDYGLFPVDAFSDGKSPAGFGVEWTFVKASLQCQCRPGHFD
ncbi:hypothetical protein [Desulfonatronum thiosulfatophilum]|uniref:hypothetical protein n=1 Tax=Desulfonatronum thiosulfatophilum TaxID=617002 RepID=UPI000B830415|nr:hypothetical protein [Desulfonatronum thiosulfatophilum]